MLYFGDKFVIKYLTIIIEVVGSLKLRIRLNSEMSTGKLIF